ncbi:OLC1v1020727C1 [Oldenlandia corymbosa var. corymbosa]|uniref:OLC1v1020727C1 n=1 Tax=Oldenlandia corymbosa var. corymbosa TaxID=529605 RepID=A0AAV1EH87_OLDCO|nr:OLC1v1020727C1 [Oldenlandia corymbosa var. corymbosa]
MRDLSLEKGSSSKQKEAHGYDVEMIMPKVEVEDLSYDDSPPRHTTHSMRITSGENVASSSSSCTLRSSFVGMGFAPSLVDRAIIENGEGNVDLILETLFTYSALENQNSDHSLSVGGLLEEDNGLKTESGTRKDLRSSFSSDSLDNLLDGVVKEEPDEHSIFSEKRICLMRMSFSKAEVDSAMNMLGGDASINDLVDFIFAARMADKCEKAASGPAHNCAKNLQQCSTEALFGTMEKTLMLFEMGFTEQQISTAIDICGSELPVSELAAAIVTGDYTCIKVEQYYDPSSPVANNDTTGTGSKVADPLSIEAGTVSTVADPFSINIGTGSTVADPSAIKAEDEECSNLDDTFTGDGEFDFLEKLKGKRPKGNDNDEGQSLKRPKEEYDDEWEDLSWLQEVPKNSISVGNNFQKHKARKNVHKVTPQTRAILGGSGATRKMTLSKLCNTHNKMVDGPPYFFYGSALDLNQDSWCKISQFLCSIQPELVNTELFSAISRQEGYVHNLPTENRFHVLPKPPMTIEEALPRSSKWWPSWDTRKHLSFISSETKEVFLTCERIGRMLENYRGVALVTKQTQLLEQFKKFNLVWVGINKVAPIQPEDLERILGYPMRHTLYPGVSLEERLQLLKDCFQVDTLAYHFSPLKSLFSQGLTILSIYSGVGGVEVALHKLGLNFKVVVSVESSETNRRILKHWWEKENISGELIQIESIQNRVGTAKLEDLINKYQGFDIVVGQNPSNDSGGIDFRLFYEFVRALQRVRSAMRKTKE